MESAEIYAQKEKERLMHIYEHGNREARRKVLSELKVIWKHQQKEKIREKAKKAIEQRTK